MYKRYIGNTGKFYRVEDVDDMPPAAPAPFVPEPDRQIEPAWTPPVPEHSWEPPPQQQAPPQSPPPVWRASPPEPKQPQQGDRRREAPPPVTEEKSKFDLGAVFQMPGSLRAVLRDKMPEAIDLGDILLVLVLLYLFLEGEEDEMLIILGVLLFMWVWPLFGKDDD